MSVQQECVNAEALSIWSEVELVEKVPFQLVVFVVMHKRTKGQLCTVSCFPTTMGMRIKIKNEMLRIGFIVDIILLVQPTASPV
ncbi:hypothetical protein GBAR_LOCUS12113 [Geodia barretti]|uniref:Uncharacterized protein n=1 Tax=Geodia barretti TaxID=519541 RepID=A0AA35WMV5_GEOBA|nr:hypothetical protein GBAR_LOCUS12113 [Geodia barretti]